jgi:LytR cell envelope-related transcriptional attenuator
VTGPTDRPPGHEEQASSDAGFGQPQTRVFRAALILAVLIVVAIVVLPSATRSPRAPSTVLPTSHHTSAPPPTTSTTEPVTTTTVPSIPHSRIAVLVANGTSTAHGASEVRSWLGTHGFAVSSFPPYNTTTPQSSDAVYVVGNGSAPMAEEVAAALSLTGSVVVPVGEKPPVATSSGADVVVVLGTDLASRADAGKLGQRPASSTT